MRVLQAAKLRALSVIGPGFIDLEGESRRISGQQIAFAGNVWRPETVNHIFRISENEYGSSDRNVNLIGGCHRLVGLRIWIDNFPPPLMACDLDGDWIPGCQSFHAPASDHAYHKDDEQCYDRDADGGADGPTCPAFAFFIMLNDGKRIVG